jgi:membrane-associated phospholipid phosphatase
MQTERTQLLPAAAPEPAPAPSPWAPLAGAALVAITLIVGGALALGSHAVRAADASALRSLEQIGYHGRPAAIAERLVHLNDPLPTAVLLGALVAVALFRGRPRTALAAVVVVLGANLTTQILKPALATPRFSELLSGGQISAGSWPSGHATAAMTLALCAVLVSSVAWRPLVAVLGAVYAIAVGDAILVLAWHFPSDVLGGFLVAALWVLLAAAALRASDRAWPERTGRRAAALRLRAAVGPSVAVAVLGVWVAAAAVVMRPGLLLADGAQHPSAVAAAAAVGALGLAVAAGVTAALRR